jgi:hypothetical protein
MFVQLREKLHCPRKKLCGMHWKQNSLVVKCSVHVRNSLNMPSNATFILSNGKMQTYIKSTWHMHLLDQMTVSTAFQFPPRMLLTYRSIRAAMQKQKPAT